MRRAVPQHRTERTGSPVRRSPQAGSGPEASRESARPGGPTATLNEHALHHPTATALRQATAVHWQRSAGNARLARAVNRVTGRSGPVLDGRYHHRSLRSPREVRRALAYVLTNARRHLAKRRNASRIVAALDPASSARWFDGWRHEIVIRIETWEPCEVARPRTWLLRAGWRRA